jgi:hypothetical protein
MEGGGCFVRGREGIGKREIGKRLKPQKKKNCRGAAVFEERVL